MSIQTELTRITNAKAAIVAAIEGKGVTVPDGTLLDGMASLIESIEAGGGGDKTLAYGEFTPSIDCGVIEIEHGLGVQPKMFVEIEQFDNSDFKQHDNMLSFFAEAYDGKIFLVSVKHTSNSSANSYSLQFRHNCTYSDLLTGINSPAYGQVIMANETKVVVGNNSSFYRFRGGKKIYWVAKG